LPFPNTAFVSSLSQEFVLKFSVFAVLAVTVSGFVSPAFAQQDLSSQQVQFSGTTYGCFGLDCTPTHQSTYSTGSDFLTFTGWDFDKLSGADGSVELALGDFYWETFVGNVEIASPFTLFIAFATPTGIDPTPLYDGEFEGLVIRGKVNGVATRESTMSVIFEPNQRDYTFTGGSPDGSGSFTLTLPETYIWPAQRSPVTAQITNATVATVNPEPMSMILLGSGLAGLAAVRRRRKQKQS
jgi:PEP-CTERM motif